MPRSADLPARPIDDVEPVGSIHRKSSDGVPAARTVPGWRARRVAWTVIAATSSGPWRTRSAARK